MQIDDDAALDADVRTATGDRASLALVVAMSDDAATITPTTLEVSATVDPHQSHDSVTSVHRDEHVHDTLGDHHDATATHTDDAGDVAADGGDADATPEATPDAAHDAVHDAAPDVPAVEPAHDPIPDATHAADAAPHVE